jgi:hypothetical protein
VKRVLLAILVISAALTVAVFAGLHPSLADFASGSGSSGYGGSGGSGSGSGGPGPEPGCSPPAPYLSVPDRLYSAAGTSTDDVWAAGLEPNSSLIMHWDGCAWSVSYHRRVGYFLSTTAISTSDAWAVGGTSWWDPSLTLAVHWDGSSWTKVSTPTPDTNAVLTGVDGLSSDNVWAVGYNGPGPGIRGSDYTPLVEHWDGTSWSVQSVPDPDGGGQLTAISATSPDDVWAVGNSDSSQSTLIEHWDGSSWTQVTSPSPGDASNQLHGVTAISADDAWAVGSANDSGDPLQAVTEHWDGTSWSVVANPDPTGDASLNGVTATSADDVWAVGYSNASRCSNGGPQCQTVAMHWDGSSWSVATTPDPPSSYLNDLEGVTALSSGDIWAVGETDYVATLITHWDGTAWN